MTKIYSAFNAEPLMKTIIYKMSLIRVNIELLDSLHLFDINIIAENFFSDLFSIVRDANYQNKNLFYPNTKAIDIVDDNNKIAIQITSENRSTKITSTTTKFNETPLKQNGYKLQIFIISERKKRRKTQENEFVKVLYIEDLIYEIAELSIYKKQKIVEFLNESINFSISEAIIDETDFNIAKQPKNLKQFYKTLNFKFNSQEEDCNLKILNEYIKKLCNIDIKTRRYFCIFVKTMYKYKENKNIVKEYPHFKKYLKISTIEHNIKHVTKQELNEIMDYMQDQELVILDKNYETDEENKLISFKGCREWGDLVFDLMDFAIAKHIDAKDFFVNLDFSSLEDNK